MNKIYVGNLPFKISVQELEQAFSQFGEIQEVILVRDRQTDKLRGFGFIIFETEESACSALDMDGKELLGRNLKVNMAKERRKHS